MYYNEPVNQRETYKLLEEITEGNFKSEIEFLKSLIVKIVDYKAFEITGGRVWEIDGEEPAYNLRFQYGNINKVPDNYSVQIKDHPLLDELADVRSCLNTENDPVLREHGILVYSMTGVGDIEKIGKKKYFKYLLGFNAPQILQSFYETLNVISSYASIRIQTIADREKQKKLKRDLDRASEIQRNLLPEHYMEFYDYKVFGVCIPDSDVGGDFFDYLKNMDDEEERLGIVVSDAASKGLAAAIQALFVSGAIRMAQFFSPKISTMLSRLNTLVFDTFPYERFVTLFYCELSLTSNRLVLYANAGHIPPLYYRREKDAFKTLDTTGGLLGLMQNQRFRIENINMHKGDILALFTDGIIEAQDHNGNIFGYERLQEIIRANKDLDSKGLTYKILDAVQVFATHSVYTDDRTIIIVKRDL